jgi:DnaJ-domain-containing protein 1
VARFLLPAIAIAILYYVWKHPRGWQGLADLVRPLLLLALALLYLRSPLDVIPDAAGPVGLLDDLLVLLAALYFGRGGASDKGETGGGESARGARGPARNRGGFDPFEVLGVARGASQDEVSRAYRDKMKQYHPDRVADLGEDLRKVAHEKSVEIQRAYEALKKK